ncbi:MAG TPA: dihydrofolate reductase family protein [Ignavibacteria bacterium]|nr:dihydrofolate reductase family protein [Ignavibacteria bacterium]
MRKLKLQTQITVDGFTAGPNGELDWMTWDMDEKLSQYINSITDTSDTILLGRKMTEGFITHWTNVRKLPDDPGYEFAHKMMDKPKVVFTKTLEKSEWENTELAKGNLSDEINSLKKQDGGDIIVYGGAGFVASLISERLIDEFHLFVNPAAIGSGMSIFKGLDSTQKLNLKNCTPYECGIAVLVYEKKDI